LPRLHPDLSRQSQFPWLHFSLSQGVLFPKGKRFQDVEHITKNVKAVLKAALLEAFADCFQKLFKPLNNCIEVGINYFE
jgi:hypothetical protein